MIKEFLTLKIFYWVAGLLAVALGALAVLYVLRGANLTKSKADLTVARHDLKSALRTIDSQRDALEICSDRTQALKESALARKALADEELALVRKANAKHEPSKQRLARLAFAPTPVGASCANALTEIRKELPR